MDQSFFAAPHGLSQRSTSFIASQRQGIHRTPLRHLIALIINVHTLGRMLATVFLAKRALDERISRNRTLMRKTRLLRKIEPTARRSSFAERTVLQLDHLAMNERRKQSGDSEVKAPGKASRLCHAIHNSDRSPLYDVRNPACMFIRTIHAK